MRVFRDRAEAGRRLGRRVRTVVGDDSDDVVVLGLPRGGVPVAFEVAHALSAPLDVIVVRKLGAPFQPDLALGAVGEDGTLVLNDAVLRAVGVSSEDLGAIERRERAEVARRCELLRGGKTAVALVGCTVVIVDDGIATGATARAACMVARARGASRVVVAVPVGPPGSAQLSARTPTRWCASRSHAAWSRSDRRTGISARSPTRRCQTCWCAPASGDSRRTGCVRLAVDQISRSETCSRRSAVNSPASASVRPGRTSDPARGATKFGGGWMAGDCDARRC